MVQIQENAHVPLALVLVPIVASPMSRKFQVPIRQPVAAVGILRAVVVLLASAAATRAPRLRQRR